MTQVIRQNSVTLGSSYAWTGQHTWSVDYTDNTPPRVLQATDNGTILLSFEPAAYNDSTGLDPGEPSVKRWNFAIGEPNYGFPGSGERPDRIFGFGYNISRYVGGTPTPQEDDTDASFGWTIEDYYNLSGTLRQFEYYIQSCPAGDDGTGQVRPFMIVTQYATLESDTAPTSGVFFDVDETQGLTITVTHAGGEDTFAWGQHTQADGMDVHCEVSAGAGFVFANNSRSLKVKGSTGTPKDICYMNSSNELLFGEGGIVLLYMQGLVRTWGVTTLYESGNNPTITDGDFTANGSSTPGNGTIAATYDTDGTAESRLWCRFNGSWKSVVLT